MQASVCFTLRPGFFELPNVLAHSKHGDCQPPCVPEHAPGFASLWLHAPHPAGLSRSDPDSPSKFAEALLGREHNSKSLQQFLQVRGLMSVVCRPCVWMHHAQ